MMQREAIGREGMILFSVVALAMMIAAFFAHSQAPLTGDMGICLPSPNSWPISSGWSWTLNLAVTAISTLVIYLINRQYNFLGNADAVVCSMFLVITASNPWVSGLFTSSAILVLANLLSLSLLFGCYQKRNPTQDLFIIATILSIGSMFQYAFIFFIPVYIIGTIILKCFGIKELSAIIIGLVAPYWVGIGLGLIPLDSFKMPGLTNLFAGYASKSGLFVGILSISFTGLLALILALYNGVKLYAGNTRRRLFNSVVNLLGAVCIICMLIDFNNLITYIETLYLICAIQLANLFNLRNVRHGGMWILLLCCGYIASFVLMV